ncbi:MAG TPA: aminotransferase class III-fold pyridoxal phosphate-dependent enzyme [Pyrinomonadaceae bacterium]|jgi:acetylornithine aminotransferase/acetylornithine/N-succinyldiaminopimelate aminotransferase
MTMTRKTASFFEAIAAREEEFQLATYKKFPFAPVRGDGAWVETSEGERFLDLYGGHAVCATGHCHPRVVEALREQAGRLLFYSNVVYSEVRADAAERLVGCAPAEITKAFFCNSGTEANENAMRMARMKTGRERVITFTGGFHGRTADSISATFLGKYREIGRPNVPGHLCAEFGSAETVAALADETVAAVMLEPVQSMAGVTTAPPEFFRELRRLCDERGMLLIFDEVQTGVGRTGSWFFAGSGAAGGVVPDVITLAKALGSGVPVGACLTNEGVASAIKENDLGTTFGGGMLAMAAVVATLEAIEADGMLGNARAVESFLRESLEGVPGVAGVRGVGLLLGIEFDGPVAGKVNKALLERRIITGTSSDPKVLRLLPPLCVTRDEAGLFVGALREIVTEL